MAPLASSSASLPGAQAHGNASFSVTSRIEEWLVTCGDFSQGGLPAQTWLPASKWRPEAYPLLSDSRLLGESRSGQATRALLNGGLERLQMLVRCRDNQPAARICAKARLVFLTLEIGKALKHLHAHKPEVAFRPQIHLKEKTPPESIACSLLDDREIAVRQDFPFAAFPHVINIVGGVGRKVGESVQAIPFELAVDHDLRDRLIAYRDGHSFNVGYARWVVVVLLTVCGRSCLGAVGSCDWVVQLERAGNAGLGFGRRSFQVYCR